MNKLSLLILGAIWTATFAAEPKKDAVEDPAEVSAPSPEYKMTEDESRLVRYLLGLKKDDVGKVLKSDLFRDGTVDKPSPPVFVGVRDFTATKQHVYLFRFGKRHIAYAWVDKGGKPIPIPAVDASSTEEDASHYGQGESVTDVEVIDGYGVYILRGATRKWLEGLKG